MLHVYFEARSFLQPFSTFCIDAMLLVCSFTSIRFPSLSFSLSSTLSLKMCLAWTDEKFQGENRGFQELHERRRKNWHYELPKHKERDATSKCLPCKVPQSLQISQHTLLPTSTHMPMSCSKNEKERCTYNTWPVRNITHLFRSTNSFCSQMFPQAVWQYLLYFKPSLKNMTGQMGFAIIEFKVSTVNLHTSVSHGLQRRDRLKWPH